MGHTAPATTACGKAGAAGQGDYGGTEDPGGQDPSSVGAVIARWLVGSPNRRIDVDRRGPTGWRFF